MGNPYPNILAFSLYDHAEKLEENLKDLNVNFGDVEVTVECSDGCDGMGQYELSSKATDRALPDHGLSYDMQLMKVECEEGILLEANDSSVYSLTPVMRASANENNHFSTHTLTVPIENEREALGNCTLKVKISDDYTLVAKDITIDTTKLDKKYNDEQGGLGDTNYPCLLCTFSKDDHRDISKVKEGFPINRTYTEGVLEGERRRVNADSETQASLKQKSKGWTTIPILTSEYARRGFDDLHSGESWGRWFIGILIRSLAGIECWNIDQTLRPLFETTKQIVRDALLASVGIDIGKDLTGGETQKIFMKVNHQKIVQLLPEEKQENFSHLLKETTFFFGVMCHPDPASVFSLKEVEQKLMALQIFIIQTYPNYDQTQYVHMGLMHLVQIIQRGKKSISAYGTQNKEAKNKMQRDFFDSFARKDTNWHALEDTYIRDTLATSYSLRQKGSCVLTEKCSNCKTVGHKANKCPQKEGFASSSGKFLDFQDFSDPLLRIRDGDIPQLESSSDEESSSDSETVLETPSKRKVVPKKNKLQL